jgi:uncharacterized lipoprotein YehR (DUF1307 family)
MLKSVLNRIAPKKVLTVTLFAAGIMMISLPSCRHQEDCGAYQGSGKGTRSMKKHHRAHVVRIQPSNRA